MTTAHNGTWRERSTSDTARTKRAAAITANRAETLAWNTAHTVTDGDRAAYRRDTAPTLTRFTTADIAHAIGVSQSAASRIRTGTLTPHVRHWAALHALTHPGTETGTRVDT